MNNKEKILKIAQSLKLKDIIYVDDDLAWYNKDHYVIFNPYDDNADCFMVLEALIINSQVKCEFAEFLAFEPIVEFIGGDDYKISSLAISVCFDESESKYSYKPLFSSSDCLKESICEAYLSTLEKDDE